MRNLLKYKTYTRSITTEYSLIWHNCVSFPRLFLPVLTNDKYYNNNEENAKKKEQLKYKLSDMKLITNYEKA